MMYILFVYTRETILCVLLVEYLKHITSPLIRIQHLPSVKAKKGQTTDSILQILQIKMKKETEQLKEA